MNLYTKVQFKNAIKKVIERKYHISPSNLFTHKGRYYIIRRRAPWAGFFANYLYVACHIQYAFEHGYIPVVDMENYPTLYNEDHAINGSVNGWEYYFEQPNGVKLKTAYESRNYIISDTSNYLNRLPYKEGDNVFELNKDETHKFNRDVLSCIPIKDTVKKELSDEQKILNGKILGVHVRGTDKREAVKDHHISATTLKYVQKTQSFLNEHNVDKILLCCDEDSTVAVFKKEFGDMVITTDAYRAKQGSHIGIHVEQGNSNRENHKYKLGYEVLRDCYLLSKCTYLIYSHSNVTNTALIWNDGKYEDCVFVENDIYIK